MTDTCNAPTVNDSECQNPTTEDGDPERCWIPSHNDPDAENPHGRDFEIDESDHQEILDAARQGLSKSGCARAAGTTLNSLNRYLQDHQDFRAAFARARKTGEEMLVRRGLADPDVDSSMAKFLLSTSFDYIKTEKRELTGEDGGSIEFNFTQPDG